jgi:hypothetical protein
VADEQGDGNKEDSGERHPIVVTELLKWLEAEPDDQKKEQGHGKKGAVFIPIAAAFRIACTIRDF